ncbi:nucleotide exchange factor GrpE [Myroides injenensis]|uniref:nucleotide exchange factor GrpE n=1 Tax=Myroides injenensis TaxID=1183151 RepID=UPI000287A51E|nr:nucleotide exchange factor GrpE [Myroides injenensis]
MSTENKDINKDQEGVEQTIETKDETTTEQNAGDEATTVEEELKNEIAKEKDKFVRLFAEFENYKKRTARERIELFKTAGQEVIESLLPVIDDFDRAIVELEKEGESDHLTGVKLISTKFKDTLESKGLQEVEVKIGDDFNADIAEAVTQIPAGDDMKGKIVDVIVRGYKLGDKIIRFPKVVIGQ